MTSGSQLPHSSPQAPLQPVGDEQPEDEQLQEQLALMAARQQQLLDILPIVIWQADIYGRIVSLSGHWQKITGRSVDSSLGWNFLQALPFEACAEFHSQWQAACGTPQSFVINLKLCHCEGAIQPFLAQGEPLWEEHQGQQIGWAGIFQPQTQSQQPSTQVQTGYTTSRKQAEQELAELNQELEARVALRTSQMETALSRSEQRYRTVIDSVKEVIFQTDIDGRWTFLNSAWTEVTGYAIRESLGKTLAGLVRVQSEQQTWRDLFARVVGEEQTVLNHKISILTKDQLQRCLEIRIAPFPDADGVIVGTFGTINDITELQRTEANLQVQANQLIQLNAELTQTTTQLEKRNQELDQFAYVASHDLKAPLRAIANLSEWIEEDLDEKLVGDTRDQMTLLRSRVLRMENLINGLLSYSRAGRLTEANQTVDTRQLVAEVIDSLAIPDTFDVHIDASLPTLTTQAVPLQQVLTNLIGNAVKHHDRDQGVIEITAEDQGKYYQFKVTDDGPGIAPQYHDKVFDIFQTLKARDSFESTGIGLSIVKKIVEAQGGTIIMSSHLGAGTTFCFTWLRSYPDS